MTSLAYQRTTSRNNRSTPLAYLGLVAAGLLAAATPAAAQIVTPTSASVIEWDLPSFEGAGTCPAAIGALVRRPPTGEPIDPLFYVTRCEGPAVNDPLRVGPTVVQFMPGNEVIPGGNMAVDNARWTAWNLGTIPGSPVGGGDLSPTGGMRLSTLGRAFVRGATQLLRLNLVSNQLTRWNDVFVAPDDPLTSDPNAVSDVAIVERYNGTVIDAWTTQDGFVRGAVDDPRFPVDPLMPPGFVQRLTVANNSRTATITRWAVDGRAGSVYLSGIAVFNYMVFYTESSPVTLDTVTNRGNSIAILNPTTNRVRRFSLDDAGLPGVSEPLQLIVDATGTVWVNTRSGHLVSLRLRSDGRADMAAYLIPGAGVVPSPGPLSGPVSLSASGGHIGFTESLGDKIGLLIPNKPPVVVSAGVEETVARATTTLVGTDESVTPDVGAVAPMPATQTAVHTDIDPLGEFVEADVASTGGLSPLGILRDWDNDTFWVTQLGGPNVHRLTRIVFPSASVTSAMATGGGTIDPTGTLLAIVDPEPDAWASDGGKANFGFNVYRKSSTGILRGNLNYVNKVTGEHVKSIQFLTFTVTGNTARFTGNCTNKGLPCTFDVTVQDNGNPGKGRDRFSISGWGIVANGGTLNGGNILIHKWW
jgi:hypothetical protein